MVYIYVHYGSFIILIGRWEDHVKRKEKLFVLSMLIISIGMFGYTLVSNKFELFAVQAILGLGGAICAPTYDVLYTRFLDGGKSASEWGYGKAVIISSRP